MTAVQVSASCCAPPPERSCFLLEFRTPLDGFSVLCFASEGGTNRGEEETESVESSDAPAGPRRPNTNGPLTMLPPTSLLAGKRHPLLPFRPSACNWDTRRQCVPGVTISTRSVWLHHWLCDVGIEVLLRQVCRPRDLRYAVRHACASRQAPYLLQDVFIHRLGDFLMSVCFSASLLQISPRPAQDGTSGFLPPEATMALWGLSRLIEAAELCTDLVLQEDFLLCVCSIKVG